MKTERGSVRKIIIKDSDEGKKLRKKNEYGKR